MNPFIRNVALIVLFCNFALAVVVVLYAGAEFARVNQRIDTDVAALNRRIITLEAGRK